MINLIENQLKIYLIKFLYILNEYRKLHNGKTQIKGKF